MAIFEPFYRSFYDYCHGEQHIIYSLFLLGGILAYFLQNSVFVVIDYFEPKFLKAYKMQDGDRPSREKVWKAVKLCLFNILVTTPVCAPLFYYLGKYTGITYRPEELPSFLTLVVQLVLSALMTEFCFFYSHMALHHRSIYKYFHKIHHEWTNPISITSIYAHPFEHLVGNLLPQFLGVTLIGAHVSVIFFYSYYTLWRSTINHCGYHFPYLSTPESHDFHHRIFNECYSQMGFLDALHGSDKNWSNSAEKQRNFASYTLTPMRIRFPDKKKAQ